MGYKDREKQREYDKERMRRKRGRTDKVEQAGVEQGEVEHNPDKYPALLYALTDPIKRKKLEKICVSLKAHNVLDKVYYGYPDRGVPFDIVAELLDATG